MTVTETATAVEALCVNTIRTLSIDAVQQANSGHPGTPMALAPLGYRIYTRHMRHDPTDPAWPDRDRFVLSCGHASMLLYSLLHLTGYDVSLDDLRNFRQLHSPTAGHPERGEVPGVETTTGPLGQGLANAVGMALAERLLAPRFNRPGHEVVDHYTWVLASDGDIMEGVQAEAASLAGHLGLGKLIVFYDANLITIDGSTDLSFSEDVPARYEAYGWQVLRIDDVDDLVAIDERIAEAKADARPTLVFTKTHIGIGSPLQDTSKAHGAPLGADNVRATKQNYGWPQDDSFLVPDDVRAAFATTRATLRAGHAAWSERIDAYRLEHPALADELERVMAGRLPDDWQAGLDLQSVIGDATSMATRQASGAALNAIATRVPELVGGSADLAESNVTDIVGAGSIAAGHFDGRNIHYGIREHAMAAISNGMAAHGGVRPYAATFLIFSDYMRPSIRLAALMQLPTTFVFTHDSIWLGEDGPTHQPIEQLPSLRAIPNLVTLRPADAAETLEAWRIALQQTTRPTALLLTRQKLPVLRFGDDSTLTATGPDVARGAYVLRDCAGTPEVILIGSGSEVHTCLDAADLLAADGVAVRVVSMPSWQLFADQGAEYRASVLPADVRCRVAVEAASPFGWERYTGDDGVIVGIDRFGMSAPGDQVAAALGIEPVNVAAQARAALARIGGTSASTHG